MKMLMYAVGALVALGLLYLMYKYMTRESMMPCIGSNCALEGMGMPCIGSNCALEGMGMPCIGSNCALEGMGMPCIGSDCALEGMSMPCIGSDCAVEGLQMGKMGGSPCIGSDCALFPYTENEAINQALQARERTDRRAGISSP